MRPRCCSASPRLRPGLTDEEPEQWPFDGAAGQIPERLANEFGDRICLGEPVYRIKQDADGVTVTTRDCDYRETLIAAMPPHLAGAIDYSPPLPARRIQFTQRAPMGSTIKYAAVYPRGGGAMPGSVEQRQRPHRRVDRRVHHPTDPGILTVFAIGPAAVRLAEQSEQARKRIVPSDFRTYFGDQATHPVQFVEMNWPAEKWTGGAYNAVLAPNTLTTYGPGMAAPVGRTHWAGTEMSPRWTGYFEGAVQAGYATDRRCCTKPIKRNAATLS